MNHKRTPYSVLYDGHKQFPTLESLAHGIELDNQQGESVGLRTVQQHLVKAPLHSTYTQQSIPQRHRLMRSIETAYHSLLHPAKVYHYTPNREGYNLN